MSIEVKVPRLPESVADATLVAWHKSPGDMVERDENLAERRRFPDRIAWGARGGFAGAVRELTRLDGRGFPLVKADEVSATVTQVEPGKVHVRPEATLVERRTAAARNAVISVLSGFATTTVLLTARCAGDTSGLTLPDLALRPACRERRAGLRARRHALAHRLATVTGGDDTAHE